MYKVKLSFNSADEYDFFNRLYEDVCIENLIEPEYNNGIIKPIGIGNNKIKYIIEGNIKVDPTEEYHIEKVGLFKKVLVAPRTTVVPTGNIYRMSENNVYFRSPDLEHVIVSVKSILDDYFNFIDLTANDVIESIIFEED